MSPLCVTSVCVYACVISDLSTCVCDIRRRGGSQRNLFFTFWVILHCGKSRGNDELEIVSSLSLVSCVCVVCVISECPSCMCVIYSAIFYVCDFRRWNVSFSPFLRTNISPLCVTSEGGIGWNVSLFLSFVLWINQYLSPMCDIRKGKSRNLCLHILYV